MPARNQSYKSDLLADLRNDPNYAAAYISAAYLDSHESFLVALRDVAEARIGIAKVAREAKVNREHLYRTLSREGNPRLSTLGSVLNALGMHLEVRPLDEASSPHEPPSGHDEIASKNMVVGIAGSGLISQAKTSKNTNYVTPDESGAGSPWAQLNENQGARTQLAA